MQILILGAGGVGGYFGGRLIEAGADVTYLVREKRQELLRQRGLEIESPYGNLTLDVKTVTAQTVSLGFDLILLSPKAYDLDSSLDSLSNAIGENTVILPFLNGMAHMQVLDKRYGVRRIMGGVARIVAELSSTGIVRQMTKAHSLVFGHRDPAHESIAREFFSLCQEAKFETTYSSNVQETLWTKWTFLATLAAATTLYRGSIGQIMATETGDRLIRAMYKECVSVASAYESSIPDGAHHAAIQALTESDSPLTASMLRDLLAGHRTEHEHILGEMVRMGNAKGLDLPLMSASYCHMLVESAAVS